MKLTDQRSASEPPRNLNCHLIGGAGQRFADQLGLDLGADGFARLETALAHGLARFPFTNKQDLRDNYPYGMFAVPREEVVRNAVLFGSTP